MYCDKIASHFGLTTSGYTESYSKITDFRINIQPSTAEVTALINGVYGRTYTGFTTYSGLNINDTVTVSGFGSYRVKGIQKYDYAPLKHYEVVLVLPEV